MSYFSSKSTWLSLVDTAEAKKASVPRSEITNPDAVVSSTSADWTAMTAEDYDYLRIVRDLRHRLFFHFKEWEFGPSLMEDHIRMAQAETNAEEALVHYCHARHVAVTLLTRGPQPEYLLAMLETNRAIAEIHSLMGNADSCELYAKEGMDVIRKNKFSASMDMQITKLTVRFLKLLGG